MQILVDSSVWIDYFREGVKSDKLDIFIDENVVVTNSLILAELVPHLKIRNHQKLIKMLNAIEKLPMDIDWEQIIKLQHKCLSQDINGVGIPDLLIAQNALQNKSEIYTFDNHFKLMKKPLKLKLVD